MKTQPWWVEIDPQTETEVETITEFKETKERIKELDTLELKLDDQFFESLHNKIMTRVGQTEIAPPDRWGELRKKSKSITITFSILILIVAFSSNESAKSKLSVIDPVTTQALNNLEDLENSVLLHQTSSDFFVDVAQENLNHLEIHKLENLVGKKKRSN